MKEKKYGLVVFKETKNIGDDIQSYSALRFLPRVDYYIEREKLNEFVSNNGEIVNVIMNGWYLHDITSFPPSPFINPYFISTHFTDHLYEKCPEYLSGYFVEYLKKYQPIGCRDNVVCNYLNENNIKNYWSGCMTLTINKFEGIKKEDYICAVDLKEEQLEHLRKITNKEIKVITHKLNLDNNIKLSYEERIKNVESLLKTYQKASLVVTTRLHASLPSIALETPVILIYNEKNRDEVNRLGVFLELVNHTSNEKFLNGENDKDIINIKENKKDYLKIRNDIIKKTEKFINENTVYYEENKEFAQMYIKYFITQKKYLVEILNEQKKEDTRIRDKWMKEDYERQIQELKKQYDDNYNKLEYEMKRLENKYQLREEVYNKEIEIIINNYSNNTKRKFKSLCFKIKEKLINILRRVKRLIIRILRKIKMVILKIVKGGK